MLHVRVGLTIDVSTIFHITIPWLWQSAVKTDDNHSWKGQLTVLQQKLVTFWQMPKTLATHVGWPVRILINGKKVFDMPSQSGYMSICHVETSPDVTLFIFLLGIMLPVKLSLSRLWFLFEVFFKRWDCSCQSLTHSVTLFNIPINFK